MGVLYARGLSDSCECPCGALNEDWQHLLCECPLYNDIRDLNSMGVLMCDGEWDVSKVVESSECYEELRRYASEVFGRRRRLLRDRL